MANCDEIVKMEQHVEKVETYLERVNAFLVQARAWCEARNLILTETAVELNEEGLPLYQARGLRISTAEGRVLARLSPIGAEILAAQGRIDLVGRIAMHVFLYQIKKDPALSTRINGKGEKWKPLYSGIDAEGWYWIEDTVRKARRVDEGLFIDLLTDASDYDFQ